MRGLLLLNLTLLMAMVAGYLHTSLLSPGLTAAGYAWLGVTWIATVIAIGRMR